MESPITIEPEQPYPSRYWWTKRIIVAWLVALLLFAAGRWWWGIDAWARLDTEIKAIQSRGEPILADELAAAEIPDKENLAQYMDAAANAVSTTVESPSQSNLRYDDFLPFPAEWYELEKKAFAANTQAFALARQARQFNKVDWKLKFKSPMYSILLPMLNSHRNLANLLGDTALYQHLQGNDVESIELIRDLLHSAEAFEQQPFLVSHLVGTGIRAMAVNRLIVIAPGLRIAGDPSPAPTTQPALPISREQVLDLIQVLLKLSHSSSMHNGLVGERAIALDTGLWTSQRTWLLRPIYVMDTLRVMKSRTGWLIASTQPTYTEAQRLFPSSLNTPKNSTAAAQFISAMMGGNLNRVILTDFRGRSELAMAAVIVAARLYQVDHQGRWPEQLQSLVPNYLPQIPIDCFATGGKTLGYIIINNGKRPLVYSVGEDGVDDTAKGAVVPATPQVGFQPKTLDQWRDLSRFDPPPQPKYDQ